MHDHHHDEHEHHHHGEPADLSTIDITTQAICSVTGDIVEKQEAEQVGHVRDYNGKKYYFCCNTCVKLFDKNPEKYATHHNLAMGLELKEKEHLIDNIWAFRFEPTTAFTWIAGQFIRIEIPHDNPDAEGTKRWFTVSSAPYEGIVQITTRITDSTFKQALNALPIGERLPLIEEPDGDFIWEDSDKPLVFVAGGIGITPFRSILKQRAHEGLPLDVVLVYGNRTDDVVFKDEFDTYARTDQHFKAKYVTGEPLAAEKIAELVPELNESLVYVSGPEPMVKALGGDLKTHGLPETGLKTDEFPNYTESNY